MRIEHNGQNGLKSCHRWVPSEPQRSVVSDLLFDWLFRSRPGEWITMQELAHVGGIGGWRTRCSQLRCSRDVLMGGPIMKRDRDRRTTERRALRRGVTVRHDDEKYVPKRTR